MDVRVMKKALGSKVNDYLRKDSSIAEILTRLGKRVASLS